MLAWPGAEGLDEFDSRMDSKCKVARGMGHWPGMTVIGRGGEHFYKKSSLDVVLPYVLTEQKGQFMDVEKAMISEQTEEVGRVLERYQEMVKSFRSAVKNDIAAVKASAVATEESVNRIGKVYRDTAAMLTTPEFAKAIANAERMTAALQAITNLQSHSITFAVLDKKPSAPSTTAKP